MVALIVLALMAVGLLAVVVAYAVPTIVQLRKTALAVEETLRVMTPRLEAATANLDAVLGRVDRIARGVEDGTRGVTKAVGGLGDFIASLTFPFRPGGEVWTWRTVLLNLAAGIWRGQGGTSGGSRTAAETDGGHGHE